MKKIDTIFKRAPRFVVEEARMVVYNVNFQQKVGLGIGTTALLMLLSLSLFGSSFLLSTKTQAATVSVSGTSNATAGNTIKVAVNGTVDASTTTVGAAWTISGVTANTGDIITVWIDTATTAEQSTAVTKYNGTDITGMVLDKHVLSIGSDQNQSTSITDMGQYDRDDNGNIMHTANSSVFTVDGGSAYSDEKLQILASNTQTVSGTETINTLNVTIAGTLTASGNSAFNIAGNWTNNNVFTQSTSTVNFNGSGTQTIGGTSTTTFNNVTTANTANATTGIATNIGGTLSIGNGSTFTAAGYNLTVTGATTVGGGASGSLVISSATGTKTFTGLVTTAAGSIWNNSGNSAVTFRGGITHGGSTFTAGSGIYTFDTNSQTLVGTLSIPSVTVTSPAVLTNNGALAVTTLSGTGGLTQGANATLTISGSSGITTLTATASGNTVVYNGIGSQTVFSTNYYNLTLGTGFGSSNKILQTGTTLIAGNLSLTGGFFGSVTATTVTDLTIGGNLAGVYSTFTAAGYALTVTGTTTVGGSSSILTISSATGTKIFTGLVTINSSGNWNNSSNSAVTFRGGITRNGNGVFTAGSGVQTFDTNSQALTGTLSIPRVTVTGVTLTNNGTLTVTTALAGTGGLTNASNRPLNLNFTGAPSITTLTATASGNTVNYGYAGTQTVFAANYHHLTLSSSGAKTLQTGTTAIGGNLTLSGTASTIGVIGLTIGGNVTLGSGTTFTAGAYTHNVAGNWTNNGGTFTPGSGTVVFTSTAANQNINGTAATQTFNNISVDKTGYILAVAGSTTTLNISGTMTLTAGTFQAGTAASINVTGNWTNAGTFTAGASTVNFNGGDSSVQTLTGNTTFNNFTASTASNSVGRTLKFTDGSTTTVSGTWTITGYSGKVITLTRTSTSSAWTINPTSANVTYVDVSWSTNTGADFCATYSTDSLNNTNWDITGGASCNTAPNSPSSLVQKKVTGGATLNVGDWTNETQVQFEASATDPDNPDTLQICVETKDINTAFNGSGETCGTGVAYSGSAVTVSITISSQTDATQYHWRARVKDAGSLYSSYVAYGTNPSGDGTTDGNPANRDYGIDTTAPTGGTVKDGTGSDQDWNDGSLSALDGNWTGTAPNSDVSGLSKYEYAIRRQSDGYYWSVCSGAGTWQAGANWCDNSTGTSFSQSSLNLQTGVTYYMSLRTTDNAGNTSTPIDSNGQQVLPTLSFSLDSNSIAFADLNNANNWTDTKTTTFTSSTNASNGYAIQGFINQLLTNPYSTTVANFIGTWAVPQDWTSFCIADANDCGFGYSTNDSNLQGGTADRFTNGGPKYAAYSLTGQGDILADHTEAVNGSTGAVSNEQFTLTHKVSVPTSQAAAKYDTILTVIVTANY